MRGIVWFREDLRIDDNTALYQASLKCAQGVVGVFVLDVSLWQKHHVASCRVEFVLHGLEQLSQSLLQLNIPLIILKITDTLTISKKLVGLAKKIKCQALFFNQQYEINELRRDEVVEKIFLSQGLHCYRFHDQLILPPGTIKTKDSQFFKVFTPYKRAWHKYFLEKRNTIRLLPSPRRQASLLIEPSRVPKSLTGFHSTIPAHLWPAGEKAAQQRLKKFIQEKLFLYDKQRDFPAIDGTSKLSPYLATGMISARTCLMAALDANQQEIDTGNKGAIAWINELLWREFYKTILSAFPRVAMHQPFQELTKNIPWEYNERFLDAWKQGRTGYPLVDAAMRQLNTMGWMHNRLRMVVAMFFSKNLFLDWRVGEDHFMQHLIDGDLAANNGGWQWSASTGVDAAPYFRIFNPTRQSERFDPHGDFIRLYCPELAHLPNKKIHDPHTRAPSLINIKNYPKPIVDFSVTRKKAITQWRQMGTNLATIFLDSKTE